MAPIFTGKFTPMRKGKGRGRNRREGKGMSHAFSFLDLGKVCKGNPLFQFSAADI
jgi:hypothetical protein